MSRCVTYYRGNIYLGCYRNLEAGASWLLEILKQCIMHVYYIEHWLDIGSINTSDGTMHVVRLKYFLTSF